MSSKEIMEQIHKVLELRAESAKPFNNAIEKLLQEMRLQLEIERLDSLK